MTRERVPPGGVVVFDMDGVLVDVRQSFRVAVERTVIAFGGAATDAGEILALKNQGGFNNDWDLTRELLRRRGIAVARERVIESFHGLYRRELIQRESWLLPRAAVEELRERHMLAIFTGRPRADAETALRQAGMTDAFATLVALEDVAAAKPDPEGLRRIRAEHAGAPLAAYFGDTLDDARCASTAGVAFYGVLAEDQPHREELAAQWRALGCQWIAPTVAEAVAQFRACEAGVGAATD